MFSDRFGGTPPEPSAQWEAKLARETANLEVLDLTGTNPTHAGFPYPKGIPSLLNRATVLDYAPHPQGLFETRLAISEYYRSRGRLILPEDLVLTASTSEAYSFLFKLLCNPGDEVLIPSPTYPLFDSLAELENIKLVRYPLQAKDFGDETHWQANFNFLRNQISTKCKALILVNPNNPTGHICSSEEIDCYLELAQEYQLALIVDEVFSDFVLEAIKYLPVLSNGPLVFTLQGFSKLLGLPQLKLGWIHIAGERKARLAALGHLEWIADAFLSVNTPVQLAAKDLLELANPIQAMLLERIRKNLALGLQLCSYNTRLRCLKPEAGWSMILEIQTALSDEEFALELLKQYGVLVHAGHLFGFEMGCCIVVSLLGPEAQFLEGMKRIITMAEGTLIE
jgi:alanine-synthesizing transaminase